MNEKIIMAGFGGQGIMLIGQLITYAGMYEDKEVSWLPSYGPEMRGGTANCSVVVSDKAISSPIITKATSAIIMNNPSLEKFEPQVEAGGDLYINSSLVDIEATRDDINIFKIPANDIAEKLGNPKGANMVILGAYLGRHPIVDIETIRKVLDKTMTGSKAKFVPINIEAIKEGMALVK